MLTNLIESNKAFSVETISGTFSTAGYLARYCKGTVLKIVSWDF